MVSLIKERLELLHDILENQPEPRWRVWVLLTRHDLTATDVRLLIDHALTRGLISEHDGLLYLAKHKDVL
jgi:hypothetical protein